MSVDPSTEPGCADALDTPTQPVSHWVRLRRAQDLNLQDPAERHFGDYEVLERIGVGGMGAVYRARQNSLDREVALKLMGFDAALGEELVAQFRSEARHAGRLQHPNIVPVYEIGSHENLYYFSMGLVRGPTLQDWRRQHPQASARELAGLMRSVAEAVEYAHQVGTLHLDLKPGNVLVDARGQPQITDFGLARGLGEAQHVDSIAAGTPGYMAPEQAEQSGALSPATDVWGLGGILHLLLCGRAPIAVDADGAARRWDIDAVPGALAQQAPDLAAICLHCLQPDPARRYASARALADDLQRFVDGRPVSVRRQGGRERLRGWTRREPRIAALASSLLLALLVGLAATTVLWMQAESNRMLAEHTLWDARRAAALAAAERGDGLAGLPDLVDNVAEAEASRDSAAALADRHRIGLLLNSSPRPIAVWSFEGEGRALGFAEDGEVLLAGLRDGQLVALDTGSERERWRLQPTFPPTPWGASYVGRIVPASDGRHALLYPSGSSGVVRPDTSFMHRIELASGTLSAPPQSFENFAAASYSIDGSHALLRSSDEQLQLWQVEPWQPRGALFHRPGAQYCLLLPQRPRAACAIQGFKSVELLDATSGEVLQQHAFSGETELLSWGADVSGRWLALGSADGQLRVVDVEAGVSSVFSEVGEGAVVDVSFSGGRLVVAYGGGSVRVLDLQQMAWASPRIRSGAAGLNSAALDPDGRWLLANDGRAALWQLAETASGQLEPRALRLLRHRGAVIGFQATALAAQRGLMASHGSEGELKLYRLPALQTELGASALQPGDVQALSAPQLPSAGELSATLKSLPTAHAYRMELSADDQQQVFAAGSQLLIGAHGGELDAIELPNSAQYLLLAAAAPRALVGWIADAEPLAIEWRSLDTASRAWIGPVFRSAGLPAGLRLSADGRRLLLWQGRSLRVLETSSGAERAALSVDAGELLIADAGFRVDADGAERAEDLLLSTLGRSQLLPATLEHWRIDGRGGAERIQRIDTPFAHTRVFDLGETWLGHGPRPALYREGERFELHNFGGEFGEAAAISPDRQWAALGARDGVLWIDLQRAQLLAPQQALRIPEDDVLAQLSFSADGRRLQARSHYGRRLLLPFQADARALPALLQEAEELAPRRDSPLSAASTGRLASRRLSSADGAMSAAGSVAVRPATNGSVAGSPATEDTVATPSRVSGRRDRDIGPPPADAENSLASTSFAAPALGTALDLAAHANVAPGQRFQGSRGGLGITDSAAWPQGRLRLRGEGFVLGPALQLAPAGRALGAARFPQRSPAIALPAGRMRGLSLLLANQQVPSPGGLRLRWLDAAGALLAESVLEVPTSYDGELHRDTRAHQPLAELALALRTAESRQRGGGSPHQLVYRLRVERPAAAASAKAIELDAPGATPLLLAASVH
jgi:hypothetical protein